MIPNSLIQTLQATTRVVGGLTELAVASVRNSADAARANAAGSASLHPVILAAQFVGLAEDIIAGARKDPSMVTDVVRTEVERTVARLGLATLADVDSLRQRLARLETPAPASPVEPDRPAAAGQGQPTRAGRTATPRQSAAARTASPRKTAKPSADPVGPDTPATAAKTTARKTTARKTAARKTTARKTTISETAIGESVSGTSRASKTPASATPAKKTAARKTAARKSNRAATDTAASS